MLSTKALPHWIIAGTLLVAGACAPVSYAGAGTPTAAGTFAGPQPQRVYEFGYSAIKERYLTSVTTAEAAVSGLQGLKTIDQDLDFSLHARRLSVRYADEQAADYPAPADDDTNGWAAFVVTVVRDAASLSPKLKAATTEKIYEAMFDETLAKLDKFSRYAGADEARDHRAARNGFGGIGVRYDIHPQDLVLNEVMPETPASDAHLLVGDHVTAVDGQPVAGLDQNAISTKLRGAIGSTVTLTVAHQPGQPTAQVQLQRALIVPPTVTMTMKDGVATIAISSFNQSTGAAATDAVVKAKATPGFKGVVLDLRGNPGGLLDQGVEVADLFMDHGRIVSTRGRHPASMQVYDAKAGDPGEDVPLVVLVDGGSASAAEIVTAALEDSGRAVVIGTNSYGKGTVQTVLRTPNDGEMTLTWSRFYSPTGYALHGLGVLPSICTADAHATATALLAPVRSGHDPVTAEIASWRATNIDDTKLRTSLRSSCPAGKHGNNALDAELASDLIKDPALYQHALALTAPPIATAASAAAIPVSTR